MRKPIYWQMSDTLLLVFLSLACVVGSWAQQSNSQQSGAKKNAPQNQSSTRSVETTAQGNSSSILLPVLGKGTANTIPVWTGTYTIGNSILSQSAATLTVSGGVSARTFTGDGSALTNVNANLLNGLNSSAFAQSGASNTFTGDQTINGNLNVSGFFNNALNLQGNLTDATGQQGANVLGGSNGTPGFPGNSIAPGVIGATIAGGGGAYLPTSQPSKDRPNLRKSGRGRLSRPLGLAPRKNDATSESSGDLTNAPLTSGSNVVQALSNWSTIGGGLANTTNGTFSTVAGGDNNSALGTETTVGGGSFNTATPSMGSRTGASTVAGGDNNAATADYAFVGGGQENSASGSGSVVGGGVNNSAEEGVDHGFNFGTGSSTISGGAGNLAAGAFSTVAGGIGNVANGEASFAAGCGASALYDASFVWASADPNQEFGGCLSPLANDSGPGQFVAEAWGGFFFYTSSLGRSVGATLPSGSGSWSSMSDRNSKQNFTNVDSSTLLAKIVSLPLSTWNYKTQPESIRHLGPTAQDFRAAFGLGEDDKHIATIDSEGVALAGIQALYKLNAEKDERISELKRALEDSSQQLGELKDQIQKLTALVAGSH